MVPYRAFLWPSVRMPSVKFSLSASPIFHYQQCYVISINQAVPYYVIRCHINGVNQLCSIKFEITTNTEQFPDLTQHGMFLTDQLPTWPNSHDLTILFTWNLQFVSLREGGVWGGGVGGKRALCPTVQLKNKYSWHQWKWIVTRYWRGAGRVLFCHVKSFHSDIVVLDNTVLPT